MNKTLTSGFFDFWPGKHRNAKDSTLSSAQISDLSAGRVLIYTSHELMNYQNGIKSRFRKDFATSVHHHCLPLLHLPWSVMVIACPFFLLQRTPAWTEDCHALCDAHLHIKDCKRSLCFPSATDSSSFLQKATGRCLLGSAITFSVLFFLSLPTAGVEI